MNTPYKHFCQHLNDTHKYRTLPEPLRADLVNFSTNDYLNLARDPEILAAALEAGQLYGVGATGSRLLSGNYPLFQSFEQHIASDKKTEAALVFNTGFQANFSVLAALLDERVLGERALVFVDKGIHASLYKALELSRSEVKRFRHNDMTHLKHLLSANAAHKRPRFIVTETVFGMDGDCAPLDQVISLARAYGAFLYLDEAHATGMLGPEGYGASTHFDLQGFPHLIMGTFGTALGGSGAYVACSQEIKHYLINRAEGFIYSTAPSPMVVGAAYAAWQKVRTLAHERTQIMEHAAFLRDQLQALGLDTGSSATHIVPIMVQKDERALAFKASLAQQGILVSAVRHPTVPPGTARLRIALARHHRDQDVEMLLKRLKGLLLVSDLSF